MLTKNFVLLVLLETIITINLNDAFWVNVFKFGDMNRDRYLTMSEFEAASRADPNWKRDASGIEGLIHLNKKPIPLAIKCTGDNCEGLRQEDFEEFIRQRRNGNCNVLKSFYSPYKCLSIRFVKDN